MALVQMAVVLEGDCPRWQLSGWQLSWVAVVQIAVVQEGDCPRWQLSGWQLYWKAIVLGGSCPHLTMFFFHRESQYP